MKSAGLESLVIGGELSVQERSNITGRETLKYLTFRCHAFWRSRTFPFERNPPLIPNQLISIDLEKTALLSTNDRMSDPSFLFRFAGLHLLVPIITTLTLPPFHDLYVNFFKKFYRLLSH